MKKLMVTGLVFLLLSGSVGIAGASDMTAKAYGMGGAFTGIADDLTSVLYNPAGLSQSGFLGLQINFGMATPSYSDFEKLMEIPDYMANYEDYTDEELQDKFPEDLHIDGQALVGANLKSFGVALNLDNSFEVDSEGTSVWMKNNATTETMVSFGKKLNSPPLNLGAFSYGFNLKMLRTDYGGYEVDTPSDAEILGGSYPWTATTTAQGSGFGLDVGVLAKVSDRVTLGAQVRNLWAEDYTISGKKEISEYQPSPDLDNMSWVEMPDEDFTATVSPARVMRVGASFEVPVINATLAADIDNFPLLTNNGEDMVYHLGLEKNLLFNGLSLRAGTFSQQEGSQVYTLGVGFNLYKFHVDMAAASDDGFEDNMSTVMSANMKF